jgi:hypothetical protein
MECLSVASAIREIPGTAALPPDRVVSVDSSLPKQDVEQVRESLPVSVLLLPWAAERFGAAQLDGAVAHRLFDEATAGSLFRSSC